MENFKVRIRDGEKEFEVQGTKAYIAEMLLKFGYFSDGVKSAQKSPSGVLKSKSLDIKNESPAEFILRAQVKKHVDIVVAFGYYLEKYKDMKKFTPADINKCYYDAKLETSNTSQMIILNLRRGFLMGAKGEKNESAKNSYRVTQSGVLHIEKILSKNN